MSNGSITPVINVQPDQQVDTGEIVQFDGSNSTVPDSSTIRFVWMFAEKVNPQSFSDYTLREGNQVLHSWTDQGQYDVKLVILTSEPDDDAFSELWESEDLTTVQMTVSQDSGSSLDNLAGDPETDKPWASAVGTAEEKHQEYIKKLDEFKSFRQGNEKKIRLWDIVFKIIDQVKREPDADTGQYLQRVGLSEDVFSNDYDWDPDGSWGTILGFGNVTIDEMAPLNR